MYDFLKNEKGREKQTKLDSVWIRLPAYGDNARRGLTRGDIASLVAIPPKEISQLLRLLKAHGKAYCLKGRWRQTKNIF